MSEPALKIENLSVAYRARGQTRQILSQVSIEIAPGESFGLVGESGCGKSTTAYAAMRYLPRNGLVNEGKIFIAGRDVMALRAEELRTLRRSSAAMVYQDPNRALNPTIPVARQVAECFELAGVPRSERQDRARQMLAKMRISDPKRVMAAYPHQLSGGMQQRVAIAMALAGAPALLLLDEPTTGLDATVEADILDLIAQLRREFATAILFISHNLAVISQMCDRVGVLYAGRLVEQGPASDVFRSPSHPYTAGLLRCLPRVGGDKSTPLATIPGFLPIGGARTLGCVFSGRCAFADDKCRAIEPAAVAVGPGRFSRCHYPDRSQEVGSEASAPATPSPLGETVLRLQRLNKTYSGGVAALNEVDLELRRGETLGLVGESGSGKTTLARCILGLTDIDPGGTIELDGRRLAPRLAERSPAEVKSIQIVFQNPDAALNRSHSVRRILSRALDRLAGLAGAVRLQRVVELARSVQLADRYLYTRPRQLSGGLKQRVAIARAFAGDPRIVVCDEPTSALDVSVQAAILNVLTLLQASKGVSYIFISHDLGVVRYIADRIAVMYLGRIMEWGPAERVFDGPHHPYAEALLSSAPSLDGHKARVKLQGEIPSAADPPPGCVFHTRCPRKLGPICETQVPDPWEESPGHHIRCHLGRESLPGAMSALPVGHRAID